ncbi:MAG: hypothetical protein QOC74_978, partial [Pseudonocardiales bacterium]|nr:hypothetical protein [Pseudonocardiales bacterium]
LVGGFGSLVIVFVAGGPVGFFVGKAFGVGADPAGGLTKAAGWTMPGGLTGPLPDQAVGADQAAHGTPDSEHQPAVGVGTGRQWSTRRNSGQLHGQTRNTSS